MLTLLDTIDRQNLSRPDARAAFLRRESEVRSYCRVFPVVFKRAIGSWLEDEDGRRYLDFFAAAGAVNYGHNNPVITTALIEYLDSNGPLASLDLHTVAKRQFLEAIETHIFEPRHIDYKVQFTGPTGTNAVEAALKLARKVTKRTGVVFCTNGYHGMSLGSLAATGNRFARNGAGVPLTNATVLPYDGYAGDSHSSLDLFAKLLSDPSGGLDLPAAVILECVQGEGGLNAASFEWLQRLEMLCRHYGILLIVDDIQAGCGRTGTFFSFESSGISPDLVVLSKSIGGVGLPLSVVLIRPDLDQWQPGEHNGTFRGNCLAFVAGAAALRTYWRTSELEDDTVRKASIVASRIDRIISLSQGMQLERRGRGLMQGIRCPDPGFAEQVCRRAWQSGMIIERCGPRHEVIKLMPPLTISDQDLAHGLDIVEAAVMDEAS